MCNAKFQDNQSLLQWVNEQNLEKIVTCLGDGHPGVWNLVAGIKEEKYRREILDWYHLKENLYKVKGCLKKIKKIESYLWFGLIDKALQEISSLPENKAKNFKNYLKKHRSRIPDYQFLQKLGIDIGSGSVESKIKQMGLRVKIAGAQWKKDNVSQILKLRCAYLNGDISLSICA
ncbi:MAG: hypothetical protein DSM107014_11490 [Gomphosphaeria aponina SAG 52.96 = DSM 107014]|uniref:Transposase n=1 Tax=Gomphosphaeria aponina SAG 52.96 = DSM 107014 TaxID=1521640 RepID=A0A941GYF4_9CHRO|nr:hypothetical protein [Gomphosphaeria aponina SAG 52.96 = DSM 107014]